VKYEKVFEKFNTNCLKKEQTRNAFLSKINKQTFKGLWPLERTQKTTKQVKRVQAQ